MICFAKPGLTGLDIMQNEEFSIPAIYEMSTFEKRPSIFIKEIPILSSERMLHKDYESKGSVVKKSLVMILKGLVTKTN
jgi:hypothetical protein